MAGWRSGFSRTRPPASLTLVAATWVVAAFATTGCGTGGAATSGDARADAPADGGGDARGTGAQGSDGIGSDVVDAAMASDAVADVANAVDAAGSDLVNDAAVVPPDGPDGLDANPAQLDGRAVDATDAAPPPNDGAAAERAEAGSTTPAWAWVGVVGTGQSLSVGDHGTPVSLTTQRYANLKLSLGNAAVPPFDPRSAALAMVPLVEPIRALAPSYPGAYPRNIFGETPHTAMANQISALFQGSTGGSYVTVHTVVGESGQPMTVIRKGAVDTGTTGRAYAATLFEVAAIARLAAAAGKSYGVGAIVITHGEADATSATYEADLFRLWSDYNLDLPPLTGQTARIPMLVSQQNSTPWGVGVRSASTLAEWRVGVDHPGDIICSGPKYQYRYATDFTHLANPREYERLGEKYGEIFFEKVVLGRDWRPLEPTTAERASRTITVHFHVPVPPLAWEAGFPAPHQVALTEWAPGRGFEIRAGATRIGITSVQIAGDAVQVTAASDLPAAGVVVGYAMSSDDNPMPGGTQRWGQLRDSDPFVGTTTNTAQPNFAVAFELNVP